jgi:phenylpyruvate tautomerase PptA (4-oxalocrotonate tautomerase family)
MIRAQVAQIVDKENKEELVKELSAIVAEGIGKPEQYVAALFEDNVTIAFGGEVGEGAFVEVRSIGGLDAAVNNALAERISGCLKERLGIDSAKIYCNFTDIPASSWAWKGRTFG